MDIDALCLQCELDFGVLLVQTVGEAGDVLLFDPFYHVIYIPVLVCRFHVQRTQTKSVTVKLIICWLHALELMLLSMGKPDACFV